MYSFKTLRRPAAWMLALVMVLSLLPPVTLPAQAMEICELWVGGQRITEDNLTVHGSSGTATYDPAANTLTLDNYYYSGEGHHEEGLSFAYGIYASNDLNIVLKGENYLYLSSDRAPEDLNAFHGIYAECGLTIEGDGWLEVAITGSGCTWGWSYGIYAETLTIRDSEIYTRGGNHGWSCGIRTDGDLTLENADISAIGDIGGQQSRGIHAEGKLYLRNTTLEAYTVTSDRQAIYAQEILPDYDENYRWTTSEEDIPTTGNLNYRNQRYFRITPVETPLVEYDLKIGDTPFTSKNLVMTDENGGTAAFDPDTNTLTLTDFTYEGTSEFSNAAISSYIYGLTILLSGDNNITHVPNGEPSFSYGIFATGPLTVDVLPGAEYGRLEVRAADAAHDSYALYASGDLTVDGGTVYGIGGASDNSYGIYTCGTLVTNDGLTMGVGGRTDNTSSGIYAEGGASFEGGTVYGNGGTSAYGSYGIHCGYNDIAVSGGFVSATGADAQRCSYGVYTEGTFSLHGGELEATGGSGQWGNGVGAENGIYLMSGGTLTAQGIGGALSNAPQSEYLENYSFWYGANEAEALAAGVRSGTLIPDYGGRPFIRLTSEPVGGDTPVLPEPSGLTFEKAFPDPVFRTYVTDTVLSGNTENKSDDAVISDNQMAVIEGCTEINVPYESKLTSLQGLAYFTSLEKLYCGSTGITELDVRNNVHLAELECSYTGITELDVSHNPALKYLWCFNTGITELDISCNPVLVTLGCHATGITELDVSHNPVLKELECYNTNLTALDVSHNPSLTNLNFHNTFVTEIDLSQNSVLESLGCSNTGITELDVRHCTNLWWISCYDNGLTSLDLWNNSELSLRYLGSQYPTKTDVPVIEQNGTWTLDMAAFLGENGNVEYVTMTDGGVLENGMVTYTEKPATVTYTYNTGKGEMEVEWTPVFAEAPHVHTHGTPGFTWPNNLSWSKAEVWCQTCATKFEADAELTWTSAPGKLILTAEAVLDGVTYTSAPLEFKVTDYDGKLTIPMPLGTLDLYMIAASYDSNGRMIDCQMAETGWNDVVFDKVGTDVRIFLTDYSFTPVSPVLYVQ